MTFTRQGNTLAVMVRALAIGAALSLAVPTVANALHRHQLPLRVVDAVASASGDRLFLSLTASDPTYPNCVVVLEPDAGVVERVVICQVASAKLAVSDDGQFLYVGAAGYVRRIRLADWQTDLAIGLGVDDTGRAIFPDDMQVMPGAPTTIAVARSFMYSTVSNTITLFDGAVARPISFTATGFRTQLAFDGTGRHLFVSGSRTPVRLDILASGVVLDAPSVPGPSLSTPPNIAWHNGRLYVGRWVWNPDTLTTMGSFPDEEFELDRATGRRYTPVPGLQAGLVAYDLEAQRLLWSVASGVNSVTWRGDHVTTYAHGAFLWSSGWDGLIIDLQSAAVLTVDLSGPGRGGARALGLSTSLDTVARLVDQGEVVPLEYWVRDTSEFLRWDGDPDCADGVVTMDGPRACVAVFDLKSTGLERLVALRHNDLAYSSFTGKLYASVSTSDPHRGNTITEIDPQTGEIGRSLWVGAAPGQIVLSEDGATLHVALTGASAVRRVDLSAWEATDFYSVGAPTQSQWPIEMSIATVPGDPESLLVAAQTEESYNQRVSLFRRGVALPQSVVPLHNLNLIMTGPTRAFGVDDFGGFYIMDVGPSGVGLRSVLSGFAGSPARMRVVGGLLYTSGGLVIDPAGPTVVRQIPGPGGICSFSIPDAGDDVVAMCETSNWPYDTYAAGIDPVSYATRWSWRLSENYGPAQLVAAGSAHVAFRYYVGGWPRMDIIGLLPVGSLAPVHRLDVSSNLPAGVTIATSATDQDGRGDGVTPFQRRYAGNTQVTLTAPPTAGGKEFYYWESRSSRLTTPSISLVMDRSQAVSAVYTGPAPTVLSVTPPAASFLGGGTLLTIRGTGFEPGAWVTFAGHAAYDVVVLDSTTLTARLSETHLGPVAVTVGNAGGRSGTLEAGFTGLDSPPPQVKTLPENGASVGFGMTGLAWRSSVWNWWGGPSSGWYYEFCADTVLNGRCDTQWERAYGPSQLAGPLQASATYEWQVRAVGREGTVEADGGWWTFVAPASPGCLTDTRRVYAKPSSPGLEGMWQPTGVFAVAGQALSMKPLPGQTWQNAGVAWPPIGDSLNRFRTSETNVPRPGDNRMALVARIGPRGIPFVLGGGRLPTLSNEVGEVFLAPNDLWYATSDNAGFLDVALCPGEIPCVLQTAASVPMAASAGAAVTFTGVSSGPSCTSPVEFTWDFGDGTAASTETSPTHTYASVGSFTWTLTVRAGAASQAHSGTIVVREPGACLPSTHTIAAKPSGSGVAGMWQATGVTVQAGESVTLDAVGQTWTNGGRTWTAAGDTADVLAQGENAPMSGAPRMALVGRIGASGTPFLVGTSRQVTAAATGALYLAPNDYWYLLWDNAGSLNVSACVGAAPCSVQATATVPTTGTPAVPVSFAAAATASTSCTGTPTFAWDFGDTATSTDQHPAHTYAAAGTYTWTLTVHVGSATDTRTGTITVQEAGSCVPTTRAVLAKPTGSGVAGMWQATGQTVRAGESLTLSVSAGQTWTNGGRGWTADGDAADVLTQGENSPLRNAPRMALAGRIGTSGTPFLIGTRRQLTATSAGELFLAPNDYWYLLWDNAGSLNVSVCAGAAPCSVEATATVPATGAPATPVTFTATATATSCASAPTYEWDFGDGSLLSTEQSPTHAYAAAGTYTWTLTVRAGTATATRTGTITIRDAGSCTPTTHVVLAKPTGSGVAGMWQATGVQVTTGDGLAISVAGSQTWTNGGRAWTADGDAADVLTQASNCPLGNAPRMALIGRIGANGTPFLIGSQKDLVAAASGELFLAPNDYWYWLWDNVGSLTVTVCK